MSIFIIISSGGHFDDAYSINEGYALTEPEAIDYCQQRNDEVKYENEVRDKVAIHYIKWSETTPCPMPQKPLLLLIVQP